MKWLILLLTIVSTNTLAFTSDREVWMLEEELSRAFKSGDNENQDRLMVAINERNTWLTTHTDKMYIMVNTSAQRIQLIKDTHVVIDERVIVGKGGMETPIFSDRIKSIVFNPVWHIPPDLAADMLPKMQESDGWEGYKVYVDGEIMDDVNNVLIGSDYRIIQDSGEENILGKIKFNLPNPYGVYIHDTPNKNLFNEEDRRFSAGCVRMENPDKLAAYLLDYDRDAIYGIIDEQTTMEIPLSQPVNVYIVDWNVYVDNNGDIIYRH